MEAGKALLRKWGAAGAPGGRGQLRPGLCLRRGACSGPKKRGARRPDVRANLSQTGRRFQSGGLFMGWKKFLPKFSRCLFPTDFFRTGL